MSAIYRMIPFAMTAVAFGQTPAKVEFEVASIKPSGPQQQGSASVGVHIDGAQVRCTSLSIKDYIGMAYRMKAYQITGPDFLASERFDISAKIPEGSKPAQIPEMMQALLAERFHIGTHLDKKELPAYVLEVAKGGVKLRETPADGGDADRGAVNVAAGGTAAGVGVNLGNGSSYTFSNNRFEGKKLALPVFAGNLERFLDRPVVDMTDLKGQYDFVLELTVEDYRAMLIRSAIAAGVMLPPEALRALDGGSMGSLFDALQKLGLKMEARKAPLDMLVVDQALKAPTDN